MIYEPHAPKKEISLKIKTLVIDEADPANLANDLEKLLARAIEGGELSENEIDRMLEFDEADEIELCTEATIETNANGQIEISYRENEDDPQMSTVSKIIFHPDHKELLAMSKQGAISTVLSFEEGKMHVCAYDTPFMPFKVYVNTNKLDNRLLENGRLKLDYILNLNDTAPQHFIITVSAKEVNEDPLKDFLA
ncbi:MAG: DUF1934 family protein [Ruminococcaceae bacterium]|nr:DUF1934 family protein [Oscillospiraceae bacterium]